MVFFIYYAENPEDLKAKRQSLQTITIVNSVEVEGLECLMGVLLPIIEQATVSSSQFGVSCIIILIFL
jgi:hypothetical protein